MKSNLGTDKAFIRTVDIATDVGSRLGNLPLPKSSLHEHSTRFDRHPEEPHLTAELTALLRIIRRQFWFIAAVTSVILCASLIVIFSLKKEYTATTLIMLDERNARILEPSAASTLAADGEVEILKSDSLALKVVKRLGLNQDPTFLPEPSLIGQSISDLTDSLTSLIKQGDTAAARSEPNAANLASVEMSSTNNDLGADLADPSVAKALRVFISKVNIRRRGLTDVIAIDVTDTDSRRAAQYSNTYAEVYLEEQVATKLRSIEQAEAALSRRLSEINDELKRSETHIGLRQVYQDSLQRMKVISQQRDAVGPDARIASQARPPDLPSFPNRKLLFLLAAVGGLSLIHI